MKVSVIGQGFVGKALAKAAMASGHSVQGIETDREKILELRKEGFTVSDDYSLIDGSEVIVIAVPTPLDDKREPELTFLQSACESIRDHVSEGTLIVNESTSYPGTLRNLIAPLIGIECLYASAPERIDPGNEKWNIRNTPRLVSGLTEEATELAIEFYKSICESVVEVSSPEVAESAKLFENTFRQVNIALANEFAQLSSFLGVSTHEVISAAATKPYGFMPFFPSVGVGGHCIPVDPNYLSFIADKFGFDTQFISVANKVNLDMPNYIATSLDKRFSLSEKKVQVAGITYKPGVPDTRESPSWALIECLRKLGASVSWFDPLIPEFKSEFSSPISKVDIGIIATAHPGVDYGIWREGTIVVDVSLGRDLEWPKYL